MKKAAASSILIAAILLAVAVIAEAQQPKKISRIGYLYWIKRTLMDWAPIHQEIQICRHCEAQQVANLRVPPAEKRHPPWEPLRPVRLYFVSVAPPWGGDYFWSETSGDAVRDGLFKALRSLPKPLDGIITTCRAISRCAPVPDASRQVPVFQGQQRLETISTRRHKLRSLPSLGTDSVGS